MQDVYVNKIDDQHGRRYGVAVIRKTIYEDLVIMYGLKANILFDTMDNSPLEPFYFLDKYAQFVVYFKYDPPLGMTLKFTDFENSSDQALDEYLDLEKRGWTLEDRTKIMTLFGQISSPATIQVNLVVQDPI